MTQHVHNDFGEQSLFSPKTIPFADMLGKTVILAPVLPDYMALKKIFGFTEPDKTLFCAKVAMGAADYPNLALCGGFIGGSLTAMLLEVLVAKGATSFLFFGLCGSINPNFAIGDIFLAESAFSDEGTSRHYSNDEVFRPNANLLQGMEYILTQWNHPFKKGRIASIDAIFRETKTKIEFYQAQNCVSIDMETAPLFAVAQHLNVPAGGIFVVSDIFLGSMWQAGFAFSEFIKGRKDALNAVKDMAIWMLSAN